MPLSPEQKRQLIIAHGVNPDEYDLNESEDSIIPKPFKTPDPSGDVTTTVNLPKDNKPSMLESFGRGAAESVLPGAASLGAIAGTLALMPEPVFTKVGAGIAALLAGTGVGIGASKLQREVVPQDIQNKLFTRPEDLQENPVSSILGGFVGPGAFRPSFKDIPDLVGGLKALPRVALHGTTMTSPQAQALLNAGINTIPSAGMYGYDVASGNRDFNLKEAAAEILPGLLMTRTTPIGRKFGFSDPTITKELLTPVDKEEGLVPATEPTKPTPKGILPEESQSTLIERALQEKKANEETLIPKGRAQTRAEIELQRQQQEENDTRIRREKALKEADYRRMEAEVEAENQKAIAAEQEVERLRLENERRKVDLAIGGKKGYGEETPSSEVLRESILKKQIEGPTTKDIVAKYGENPPDYVIEGLQRDYDKAVEKAKSDEQNRKVEGLKRTIEELKKLQKTYPSPKLEVIEPRKRPLLPNEKLTTLDTRYEAEEPTQNYLQPLEKQDKPKFINKLNEGKGYYQEESALPPALNDTPIETFPQASREKIKKEIERVAKLRNQRVTYVDSLKNKEGKEILGQYDPLTRSVKLNRALAAGDTAPHETGHGRILDFLASSSDKDKSLVLKGLEFADPQGRKFKTVEDYQKLPLEEQMDIEEKFTSSIGKEGYRRQLTDLFGKKRERFAEWIDQIGNHFKVKTGKAGSDELVKHFVERQMYDAPDLGRVELNKGLGGGSRSQEESNLPDWAREQMIREGLNPKRTFNDVDLQNKSVRDAINSDPTLTEKEKNNLLTKGSRNSEESSLEKVPWKEIKEEVFKRAEAQGISREVVDIKEFKKLSSGTEVTYQDNSGKYHKIHVKGKEGFNPSTDTRVRNSEESSLPKSDIEQYDEVQKKIKEKIQKGEYSDEEFQKLWKQNEEIKNRNGGMPPKRNQEESSLPSKKTTKEETDYPEAGPISKFFSSATKAIRNIGGETAAHASNQSEKYFAKKSLYEGFYSNAIKAEITSYPKEVRDTVDQFGREMHTNGKSNIKLNPQEKSLYDSMRKYLIKIADENTAREIKKDPNYWPAILDTKVASVWSKAPNSAEGRYYQKEWMKHAQEQVKKGRATYTNEELKKLLENYMASVTSEGKEKSLEFGALRKAAGLGLPIEMQDNNLLSRFGRYGNRVAKDMAFRETIESDPTMRYLFRLPDDKGVTLTEAPNLPSGKPGDSNIRGAKPLQDIQRLMYEEFQNNKHPKIQSVSRLVNSMLLGGPTGVRDLVTTPLNLHAVIGSRNAGALIKGFENLAQGAKESYQYGARKIKMNELEFGSAAHPDTLTQWFDEVSDAFRKYSGREVAEQASRIYSFNVGKVAAVAEFGRAANHEKTSIDWLKKHGNTVDNLDSYIGKNIADIPPDVINRIAKNVVDRSAGSYDARGLPIQVMEGPLAPFLSLSRWSIEKANTIVEDVIKPAREGNFVPLLSYTVGSFLTGAAIQELNKLMLSGKKSSEPTLDEASAAGQQQIRAVVNLLQLGSFGGIIGEMMKTATEAYSGHTPKGLSFPLADFVSDNLQRNLSDYFGALQAGEDKVQASLGLAEAVLTQLIQNLRVLSYATWNKGDIERKNAYRDYRLWQELTNRRAPEGEVQRPNELLGIEEKKFKRAKTIEESVVQLPKAIESIISKSGNNPLEVVKGFDNLKRNSYQTWPTEPTEQIAYYEYLKKTEGDEKAAKSFMNFLQQSQVNKIKNEMVPNL